MPKCQHSPDTPGKVTLLAFLSVSRDCFHVRQGRYRANMGGEVGWWRVQMEMLGGGEVGGERFGGGQVGETWTGEEVMCIIWYS